MKKILVPCLAVVLFLSACDNSGSSTVGVYENPEEAAIKEKTEEPGKEVDNANMEQMKKDTMMSKDTMMTTPKDTSKAMHE